MVVSRFLQLKTKDKTAKVERAGNKRNEQSTIASIERKFSSLEFKGAQFTGMKSDLFDRIKIRREIMAQLNGRS